MFGQSLPQLELPRLRRHPRRHRFHQPFVVFSRDGAVGLVPRASAQEREQAAGWRLGLLYVWSQVYF
jgi:hypothetical protein